MYIDCHTHCRDEKVSYKETIGHALRVAEDSGLSGIFDMPNIPNPITTRKRVLDRIELAKAANSKIFFGVYIGLTSNQEQIKEAVETCREFFPKPEDKIGVIGLKMFAGKSVDDLTVSNSEEQQEVYNQLTKLNYQGVLDVHCEKESEMHPELWNPLNPITHCYTRPEKAETSSIKDQIRFARETEYQGHLHIVHVSTPFSVVLVDNAKRDLRISCGVTPHHLLLGNTTMINENGIFYKMNPPLRNPETKKRLFEDFLRGKIDILESDHAPHTLEEKTTEEKGFLSGIPNLASWPDFISLLMAGGISQELLNQTAYKNINRIFGTQIPRLNLPIKKGKHLDKYVFDPYESLK